MPDVVPPRPPSQDHARIDILPYLDEMSAAVRAVADDCLGRGYLRDLRPVLSRPGLVFEVALDRHAPAGDAVAGFVFGWQLGPGDLDDLYPALRGVARPPVLAAAESWGRLGILKTIAVAPGHRGRGLGNRLFRECVIRLALDGADALVVPAWTVRDRPNLGPVLDRHGCVPWAEVARPWQWECDHAAFDCPHRTAAEGCVCGLRLYGKAL